MARTLEIRLLRRDDDRSAFSCGQSDLDRFFHHYAGQNQFKLHLAATYVAERNDTIVGFATVTVGSLERKDLPSSRVKGRLPGYPLPVVRLARMGVHLHAQGFGVGQALLGHVLDLAVKQHESLGCIGVVTDAKPDAVSFYERYGFSPLEGVRNGALHGESTPMFLSMENIIAAR